MFDRHLHVTSDGRAHAAIMPSYLYNQQQHSCVVIIVMIVVMIPVQLSTNDGHIIALNFCTVGPRIRETVLG